MTITLTEKEYEAISFAINQVESALEGASDEDYIEAANASLGLLENVMYKYKKARQKANDFQYVRAEVARRNHNRGMRPRDIDALTRKLIKEMNK